MNAGTTQQQNNLTVFLLGAILNLMAAIDFHSLVDYSAKALAGGLIWLVFKVIGDVVARKINSTDYRDKGGSDEK